MLKLTGGEFRGRSIETPAGDKTRPTQAKLRQALFNSLQFQVPEANVLDLFAGSGSLGFEALSRGASQAIFVETNKATVKLIEKNIATLKVADRAEVIGEAIDRAWPRLERFAPFDVVLADPPYALGWEEKVLKGLFWSWEKLLKPGGIFCLEWGSQKSVITELPDAFPFLVKIREKNYGDSVLTTYQRTSSGGESGT